VIHLTSLSGG